ncbi:MAG: hypothetical protein QOK27_460 [Gemmatimonadales bacterium]|nr:hypothetical protein [Gemmatimonadales bacterium]
MRLYFGEYLLAAAWLALPVTALAQQGAQDVAVQMRHVDFHVDSTIVLHIDYLRGELRPTSPQHSPYFDDKQSFTLGIDSARIGITPRGLSDLLNRYTFAYPGSPLRRLTISIEKGRIKQQGTMRGISFTTVSDLTLTPDGELRLHPTSIKAAGMGVGGLMKFLGLHLANLVKVRGNSGVRIEKNDFFLSPAELLPPPTVKGRVGGVEVSDSEIVQVFQPPAGKEVQPLRVPDSKATNYMYYRGNVLRFGKLTMHDTDLLILDAVPEDPFDFFLDEYKAQLVAGYSRTRADEGLTVVMQDYKRAPPLPGKGRSDSR